MSMLRQTLLVCGIIASLLYAAMLVVVPMRWEGYSSTSQAVSELSAIGAPTRPLWVSLGIVYGMLLVAFAGGVLLSAGPNRRLRVAGGAILSQVAVGAFWPPMHLRGVEPTLTDACVVLGYVDPDYFLGGNMKLDGASARNAIKANSLC